MDGCARPDVMPSHSKKNKFRVWYPQRLGERHCVVLWWPVFDICQLRHDLQCVEYFEELLHVDPKTPITLAYVKDREQVASSELDEETSIL